MEKYRIYGLTISTNYKIKLASDTIPECFAVKTKGRPDLTVVQVSDFQADLPLTCPPYIHSKGKTFVRSYRMGTPCKLLIDDLDGKTTLKFTPMFRRLFDIDKIISAVIQIKMLQHGMLMVHGALSLTKEGKVIAVYGWDKSGKTTLARKLGDVLADDLLILKENGKALPYPRKMRIFKNINPFVKNVPLLNKMFIKETHVQPQILLKELDVNKVIVKTQTGNDENFLYVQSLYHGNPIDSRNTLLAYFSLCDFDIFELEKRRMEIVKRHLKLWKNRKV